jgi:hypothetical protein
MDVDQKARQLAVPTFQQIADDFGGLVTVGDVAAIVGQRMHEMLLEMHRWTLDQAGASKRKDAGRSGDAGAANPRITFDS